MIVILETTYRVLISHNDIKDIRIPTQPHDNIVRTQLHKLQGCQKGQNMHINIPQGGHGDEGDDVFIADHFNSLSSVGC